MGWNVNFVASLSSNIFLDSKETNSSTGTSPGRVAEWLARGTHDLLIAGSRLTAAT